MILIGSGVGVPFHGGIQHRFDGTVTACGLERQHGDLVYGDHEPHTVWVGMCGQCYPGGLLAWMPPR